MNNEDKEFLNHKVHKRAQRLSCHVKSSKLPRRFSKFNLVVTQRAQSCREVSQSLI